MGISYVTHPDDRVVPFAIYARVYDERNDLLEEVEILRTNLLRVQERSTEQCNEARGFRHFLKQSGQDAFAGIIGEAYAAVCRHGDFLPRLAGIADGTGDAESVAYRDIAQAECEAGERGEKPLTWRKLLEEEIAEAFAEKDPRKLARELRQSAAVIAAWLVKLTEERRT